MILRKALVVSPRGLCGLVLLLSLRTVLTDDLLLNELSKSTSESDVLERFVEGDVKLLQAENTVPIEGVVGSAFNVGPLPGPVLAPPSKLAFKPSAKIPAKPMPVKVPVKPVFKQIPLKIQPKPVPIPTPVKIPFMPLPKGIPLKFPHKPHFLKATPKLLGGGKLFKVAKPVKLLKAPIKIQAKLAVPKLKKLPLLKKPKVHTLKPIVHVIYKPVPVLKKIPIPKKVIVPKFYPVFKPVPVPKIKPIPVKVPVIKIIPKVVKIPKLIPVPKVIKVKKPIPLKIPVPVPKLYKFPIYKPVPIKKPFPIPIPIKVPKFVPFPVKKVIKVPKPFYVPLKVPHITKSYVKTPYVLSPHGLKAGSSGLKPTFPFGFSPGMKPGIPFGNLVPGMKPAIPFWKLSYPA